MTLKKHPAWRFWDERFVENHWAFSKETWWKMVEKTMEFPFGK
jgi:hypothetical protein